MVLNFQNLRCCCCNAPVQFMTSDNMVIEFPIVNSIQRVCFSDVVRNCQDLY